MHWLQMVFGRFIRRLQKLHEFSIRLAQVSPGFLNFSRAFKGFIGREYF